VQAKAKAGPRAVRGASNKENVAPASINTAAKLGAGSNMKRPTTPLSRTGAVPARTQTPRGGATRPLSARGPQRPKSLQEQAKESIEQVERLQREFEMLSMAAEEAQMRAYTAEMLKEEAQQEFLDWSAANSAEYTARENRICMLEDENKELIEKLKAQRVELQELSRRNIQLDKENAISRKVLDDAEAELERMSKSQEELDAELDRRRETTERVKQAANEQADRCARDIAYIQAMRERVTEVSGDNPTEEAQRLLDEAICRIEKVKEVQHYCQKLHENGPLPEITSWESPE